MLGSPKASQGQHLSLSKSAALCKASTGQRRLQRIRIKANAGQQRRAVAHQGPRRPSRRTANHEPQARVGNRKSNPECAKPARADVKMKPPCGAPPALTAYIFFSQPPSLKQLKRFAKHCSVFQSNPIFENMRLRAFRNEEKRPSRLLDPLPQELLDAEPEQNTKINKKLL